VLTNARLHGDLARYAPSAELIVLPAANPGRIPPTDFGHAGQLITRALAAARTALATGTPNASTAGPAPPGYGWPDRTLRPTHKTEILGQFSSLRCFRSLRAFPRRLCLARRIQWPWLCAVPAALAMSAIGYYFAYRRIGHQSAADSSPVSTGAATRQDHRPQPAGRPGVQQHTDRLRRPARPGARTRRAGHAAVSFTHSVSVAPDISPESGDDLSPSRR